MEIRGSNGHCYDNREFVLATELKSPLGALLHRGHLAMIPEAISQSRERIGISTKTRVLCFCE